MGSGERSTATSLTPFLKFGDKLDGGLFGASGQAELPPKLKNGGNQFEPDNPAQSREVGAIVFVPLGAYGIKSRAVSLVPDRCGRHKGAIHFFAKAGDVPGFSLRPTSRRFGW